MIYHMPLEPAQLQYVMLGIDALLRALFIFIGYCLICYGWCYFLDKGFKRYFSCNLRMRGIILMACGHTLALLGALIGALSIVHWPAHNAEIWKTLPW